MTVKELRDKLVKKATADKNFRKTLLNNPKLALKEEGFNIPEGFTVKVHEDTEQIGNLVLPPSADLNENELQKVSGGAVYRWTGSDYVGIDNLFTLWDDFNGPTYHGGPKHNAD